MATGITGPIHDGKPVSFERFIWTCARMMTPLIMMRDEDMEKLPPEEFRPCVEIYDAQIAPLRAEISRIEAMDAAACEEEARGEYAKAVAIALDCNRKAWEVCARYREMLAKVEAWQEPTKDHATLKSFARNQLTESIRIDGYSMPLPEAPNFSTWQRDRLAQLRKSLAQYEHDRGEEISRTAWRNAWMKTLRESVPYPIE